MYLVVVWVVTYEPSLAVWAWGLCFANWDLMLCYTVAAGWGCLVKRTPSKVCAGLAFVLGLISILKQWWRVQCSFTT